MDMIDWTKEDANGGGGIKHPTPGGYICRVIDVEDDLEKKRLKLFIEIVMGDFKGYGEQMEAAYKFWPLTAFAPYEEGRRGFLASILAAMEESNNNFKRTDLKDNADILKGKLIGAVLNDEIYWKQDGTESTRTRIKYFCSGKTIKEGDFKVPDKPDVNKYTKDKYAIQQKPNINTEEPPWPTDDDLPF